ncbi:TetR/AcrR family transcriptional regulator [Kineothrix sedimenti]|uniref:TetR/AcrR family transcriptional regulator n=1 Tax=Kineothrix sedimenti TaxID=3123317 RepID=A0ABZ3EUM5_9FIRM
MSANEIRIPKQKRSIEKKDAIIKASYGLFCEKGYYKTNTAEIAKEAGVSTGIVYSYFHDKKDILIEVVKLYIFQLEEQFKIILDQIAEREKLAFVIGEFIDLSISSHKMNRDAHNEFLALALLNNDIQDLFNGFEYQMLEKLYKILIEVGYSEEFLIEKLRISYGIIEQLCHDYIQGKTSDGELNKIKFLAVPMIMNLLGNA